MSSLNSYFVNTQISKIMEKKKCFNFNLNDTYYIHTQTVFFRNTYVTI
jgi:hypothetical protein